MLLDPIWKLTVGLFFNSLVLSEKFLLVGTLMHRIVITTEKPFWKSPAGGLGSE